MIVTPVAHGLEDLIGKSGPRTPGFHISTAYNALYEQIEPDRYAKKGGPPDPARLEAGLAFEQFLEQAIKERLSGGERPGELTHEEPGLATPILYNPDLILYGSDIRVGEIKLTWLSVKDFPKEPGYSLPPKANKYVTQMMCYCKMLDTRLARLIGYFVNGEYELYRGGTPVIAAWDLEFTKREIEEEWLTVINFAKHKRLL